MTKVLIADISSVYKKMFIQAVAEVDKTAAVTSAVSGDDLLSMVGRHDYDIIIIDVEIVGTSLLECLRRIKKEIPKALVLLTARPSSASGVITADVLAEGAIDFMTKPLYNSYSENLEVIKNKMAGVFAILRESRQKKDKPAETQLMRVRKPVKRGKVRPELVLIAASTGGPSALETIFGKLSKDFPVPVLVVQHMPPHFTETLAKHLGQKSQLQVKVAKKGDVASAGTVYLAPGGVHMKLDAKNMVRLEDSPPLNGVRPAADALFASVAESFSGTRVLAVILTGMGCDGEKGLAWLKEKRTCFCIAQSERTCVVYGMPRAVAESGLADKVLDLEEIASEIESFHFPHA